MAYLIGILIALTGIAVVLSAHNYLKLKILMAREYGRAADGFFAAAKPLVSDDETPDEILMTIAMLSELISDRSGARKLLGFLANDRWRKIDGEKNKVFVEFFHRRPELEEPFKTAMVQWFMAVTCLSPFFGKMVRIAMDEANVERAARNVSAKARSARHCDDCLTPIHVPGV